MREEKNSQDSTYSKNDRKGRNWHNQQRKKKNNDNRSHSRTNNQHNSHKLSTNKPSKEKEWPTPAEASKEKRRKKRPFFRKIRSYKQRQEERLETVEIKNYDEVEANNNDQQNEHTIIVPDTKDVPKQVEKNECTSRRDKFFLHGQVQQKLTKEEMIIHPGFKIYLA